MSDPDYYCPICGVKATDGHRCSEKKLKAIDAAMKRDPDSEEPRRRPMPVRLSEGFELLNESGAFG